MATPASNPDDAQTDSSAELVEVLDEHGNVERIATRRELREGVLRHRSTFIVVRRTSGAFVVHRRADWKDFNPGIWDIAFGGVCGVGEPWELSARRELAEEAGLETPLQLIGSGNYDEADGRVVGRVFLTVTDDELTCPDGEVAEIAEVHDLKTWLSAHKVCADSIQIVLPLLKS